MTVQYGISCELPMPVHPKFTVSHSNSNVRDVSWSPGYLFYSLSPSLPVSICECDLRTLPSLTTCIQRHTRATTDSADGSLVHEGQGSNAKAQSHLATRNEDTKGAAGAVGAAGAAGAADAASPDFPPP